MRSSRKGNYRFADRSRAKIAQAQSLFLNQKGVRKMDLHDYKDVAENYDRYLEVMYETENHYEGFEEFYLQLAKECGREVSNSFISFNCFS